jgi:hypothetical protein
MNKLFIKVAEKILGIKDERIYTENTANIHTNYKYSIGISTFDKRFEKFLIPLIEKIKSAKPEIEIVLFANCNYQEPFNEAYKRNLLKLVQNYDNIFPHICSEFRSLSKLWNNELIFASNQHVLICNDDVLIEKGFWTDLEYAINLNEGRSFTINKTWSHVFLNKKEIAEVGWFDERLLGVGEEDGDMQFRWEKHFKIPFPNYNIKNISNYVDDTASDKIKKHSNSKYSKFNRSFAQKKYVEDLQNGEKLGMNTTPVVCKIPDLNQYPYENFFWENRNSL